MDMSLLSYIDSTQLHCLNESSAHTIASILAQKTFNTTSSYLLSDDGDPELLLNVYFNQTVRLRELVFKAGATAEAMDQAPKQVKLLVNRPSIGFEDMEGEEPAQLIELSAEDVACGRPIPLRFVRFQAVNSLHIFITSNQNGAEETRLDALDILGVPVETTKDLSGLQKQEDHIH
ncbi:PITH domain-containing protein [Mycena kentingensis (nom. inval.)]|nr:PITH domain-containing protein [Mycena kentingensis (nom. inval.)]